ncbi:aldehyde dehydrogenase family protein [Leucobacter sp. GX24907]
MRVQPAVINGEMVGTEGGDYIDVLDPSTGEIIGSTVRGTTEHIDAAVQAARAASVTWSSTPTVDRSRILRNIGVRIQEEREELAFLESQDTGKPLSQARADVDVAARYFEFYANTIEAFSGTSLPANGDFVAETRHVPFGVTGHIIPWNYPLQIGCRTVAPAIAVGNCSVVKPAEDAPLSVVRLAQLALEAGLPAGVLNVVPGLGSEAGAALSRHPGIDHLSFTGSAPVGITVAQAAAENVTPVALELGGKSPNIVFNDADLDVAVPVIVKSMIQNAGQTCSAGSRILVQREIHEEVVSRLERSLAKISIGEGRGDPDLGPLISQKQLARVTEIVSRAQASSARQIGGPGNIDVPQSGFFFPPTIFVDVAPEEEIAREEVFGPVAALTVFDSVEDAVRLANGTDYGLIAAVWTTNVNIAHALSNEVTAGQIYINTYGAGGGVEYAFGGFKKSGYGREKGFEALQEYCQTKSIVTKILR